MQKGGTTNHQLLRGAQCHTMLRLSMFQAKERHRHAINSPPSDIVHLYAAIACNELMGAYLDFEDGDARDGKVAGHAEACQGEAAAVHAQQT